MGLNMPRIDDNAEVAQMPGLKKVPPERLKELKRLMTDEVIPEIVKVVEDRKLRATQTRQRHLKS